LKRFTMSYRDGKNQTNGQSKLNENDKNGHEKNENKKNGNGKNEHGKNGNGKTRNVSKCNGKRNGVDDDDDDGGNEKIAKCPGDSCTTKIVRLFGHFLYYLLMVIIFLIMIVPVVLVSVIGFIFGSISDIGCFLKNIFIGFAGGDEDESDE